MSEIFFKTKVLLIDDDPLIMEAIKRALPKHEVITCQSPEEAFAILECNEIRIKTLLSAKQSPIAFMRAYKKDPNIISMVFIDYSMPTMTGVELINKLGASLLQKVLLTGHADLKVAVALFNKGLIQQFISKDEPNLLERLENSIVTFKERFLQQFCPIDNNKEQAAVNKQLFEHLMKNIDLADYDSCFPVGSEGNYYVRKDEQGTLFLSVKEKDQKKFAAIARDHALDEEIVTGLDSGRSTLAFLFNTKDVPVELWGEHMVAAEKVIANGRPYYFAMVKNYEEIG